MEVDLLYKKFKSVRNSDDMYAILIEAFKLQQEIFKAGGVLPPKLREILNIDILYCMTLKFLGRGDGKRAAIFFSKIFELSNTSLNQIPKEVFDMYYTAGRILYLNKNYSDAAKLFHYSNSCRMEFWGDVDELAYFYCANSFAKLGNFADAANLYEEILKIKSDFPEVKSNLELVKKNISENLTLELYSLWNFCAWQDVPIFINARDRVGVMKQLIDWLLDAGYRNLIILDNDSTYPGLLNYYLELEKDSRIKIIKLKKNFGYKALWLSNILEDLKISTPYVYTDPDVLPIAECPKDFVKRLFKILNKYREFRKVGLGLLYEDITFYDKEKYQKSEAEFSKCLFERYLAYANVDTTFALHSNTRNYTLRFSLRTYDDMRLKHLPWYFDYDNLPEDERYYLEHADKKFVTSVKCKVSNGE